MGSVFSEDTVFGFDAFLGNPSDYGNLKPEFLSELASQLYPTGRAFNMLEKSVFKKFHDAINVSFLRFINDSKSTLDSVFPDNDNFTEEDCNLWEYRFGIITNSLLDLETRRAAIYRRMSRGRNVQARQHVKYIEYQLQLAGFNVWVHENGFIEGGVLVHKRPQDILFIQPENVQHGGSVQHGIGVQHGGVNSEVIANSYKVDEEYSVGDDYLSKTFFIGGETLGTTAIVSENRKEEFRELVLKLKPAHLVAFTFINYL